jgi:hypothetical protein
MPRVVKQCALKMDMCHKKWLPFNCTLVAYGTCCGNMNGWKCTSIVYMLHVQYVTYN